MKQVQVVEPVENSEAVRETRDSIKEIWGNRNPYAREEWPLREDSRQLETPQNWVQSACILCSNGCGMDIGVKDGKIVGVRGRTVDRVNKGRLGPKGLHGWIANQSADRLQYPQIRRNGKLERASWDEAMELIVRRTREIRDTYGTSAIGFYNSGQLFLEEYYTLGVIARAGLGTPHMDGNTRLCTATAAASLMETFGSDGQPGSYSDLDVTDTILLAGHNMASQQTVLWMRILDRLEGPDPPKIIVIDPRETFTAQKATVHLQARAGTNVAVLNGLINLIIQAGHIDKDFIRRHTTGFEELKHTVSLWNQERVSEVSGVPADILRQAAYILGATSSLVSTVLQGVYQSNQATAAACQVNNLNLIRGMIGKPGCGILQMNGQPTAQNTRETGCDGALPAFRNWDNPAHIEELSNIWNVNKDTIPHWGPPTHAMQIFRYAEEGSIKMLWIAGTNPAVSLPELTRIRKILANPHLFVIVQDAFPTETTEGADVVLPAAIWGEKTGCFTNADRTVHISHKAVDPPGEARSDLQIFLDFARRMDFKDKDGASLIKWHDPESTFEAWKLCTGGLHLCDYTELTYDKLHKGSGIQWPCNSKAPEGTERLYEDGVFPTDFEHCETFGHDLATGAAVTSEAYKANNPAGKAILKSADYQPLPDQADGNYPFILTTGRVVYHWHTRTKTARSKELNNAAPEAFIQISDDDAHDLGIAEGDMVQIASRHGKAEAPATIGGIRRGHIFMPFHYGYWDNPGRARAANELTTTGWDPVSKQPYFKYAAVRLQKVNGASLAEPHTRKVVGEMPRWERSSSKDRRDIRPVDEPISESKALREETRHIGTYLYIARESEQQLADSFLKVAEMHKPEPDIFANCKLMSGWSQMNVDSLMRFVAQYTEQKYKEVDSLRKILFRGPRLGGAGLLYDLQDIWLLAQENRLSWIVLLQSARGMREKDLEATCEHCLHQTERQISWLLTQIKQIAPQALIVPTRLQL